jgi:hypothetical protein
MKPGNLVFTPPQADNSNDATGETAAIAEKLICNGVSEAPNLNQIMDRIQDIAVELAAHPQDNIPIQVAQLRLQEAHLYLAAIASQP